MKKIYFIVAILVVVSSTVFISSRKKNNNNNGGCVTGGVAPDAPVMFWVPKDYSGGPFTVTVTNDDGKNETIDDSIISVYDAVQLNACDASNINYSKQALVGLSYMTYTYTATFDNRLFKETIKMLCGEAHG